MCRVETWKLILRKSSYPPSVSRRRQRNREKDSREIVGKWPRDWNLTKSLFQRYLAYPYCLIKLLSVIIDSNLHYNKIITWFFFLRGNKNKLLFSFWSHFSDQLKKKSLLHWLRQDVYYLILYMFSMA